MRETWRWFGPADMITLRDVAQTGARGIVSALHGHAPGEVWSIDAIQERQNIIELAELGLRWDVVESLPVSEDIKLQRGDWRSHLDNYKTSLSNLASCGIETICYNFMPVLDWTRTELRHELPNGARCMRFDLTDFVVFDLHILQRASAGQDYTADQKTEAASRFKRMSNADARALTDNIVCGLPGALESYSLSSLKELLAQYSNINADRLRQHQIDFLGDVVPTAEQHGLRLCCHPDDPPFPLLGLPRINSTEADYAALLSAVDSPANGITLCSGSLGVRADNDLPGMVRRLGPKIHFVHLRNVRRQGVGIPTSFHEAEHLEGETNMVDLIGALLQEEHRRKHAGRSDREIPFRPDHGQEILSDLNSDGQPGYPAVGRLRGLAELRGILHALSA